MASTHPDSESTVAIETPRANEACTGARVAAHDSRFRCQSGNRPGGPRRPVGFMAAVDYDDGGRDVVTTDAVVARRGAHIDPRPYVERALKS